MIKPLKDFPLLKEYGRVFDINEDTIFAFANVIYSNKPLPVHTLLHEMKHLEQQEKIGADVWVEKFLTDPVFRLKMEVEAYRVEIFSFKNREVRARMRMISAKKLSSALYGNMITSNQAIGLLK